VSVARRLCFLSEERLQGSRSGSLTVRQFFLDRDYRSEGVALVGRDLGRNPDNTGSCRRWEEAGELEPGSGM
jgi:hypothetical protein